jgi:hypothetical protein
MGLQLRLDGSNLFNHPHFNNPDGTVTDLTFMQITSAQNDERQFRLGMRFSF